MIIHTVCFKLKDNSPEACEKAKELLLSMNGRVPQIKDIEVGIDFLHSERSYDVILRVTVENEKKLSDYQKNDYHCSVVKPYMHSVRTASVSVDFVCDK